MFNAPAGITFAATIEQPRCPARLALTGTFEVSDKYGDTDDGTMTIQCELHAGHRHSKHQITGKTPDGENVWIYFTKKRGE